jgi:hypothetical protein|tara:strand:- start:1200 stop:1439 length:240 start_codon:yes stop_codon:yes gene_type:complete
MPTVILQFSENDDWEEISEKLNGIRTMAGIIDPDFLFPSKVDACNRMTINLSPEMAGAFETAGVDMLEGVRVRWPFGKP